MKKNLIVYEKIKLIHKRWCLNSYKTKRNKTKRQMKMLWKIDIQARQKFGRIDSRRGERK